MFGETQAMSQGANRAKFLCLIMGSFAAFVADFCAIAVVTRMAAGTLLGRPRQPLSESNYSHDSPLFAPRYG